MAGSAVTGITGRPVGQARRGELGPVEVGAFTASATTPMTVVFALMPVAYGVTGFTGLPVAFAVMGVVLAVFCVGYTAMVRRLAYAGAFYHYVRHGLGRPAGVGAAWVALLSYNFLQVGLYGAIGAAADPVLRRWFDLQLPWWVVAFVAWGIVSWMGWQRVKLNARVLVILLMVEIGVILLVTVTGLLNPAGGAVAYDSLNPAALTEPGFGASLAIAVLGYIGFEGTVVYVEEARDPHRTVRNASYGVVSGATVVYVFSAVAIIVFSGVNEVVADSREHGTELLFAFAGAHLGTAVLDIIRVVFVTSMLLAMVSFHNTTNRYLLALGRERMLPRRLADIRAKTGAPMWASGVQSTFAAIVIMIYAAGGWDPVIWLFYLGGTTGAVGVLLLLATTSIAILIGFVRNPGEENVWRRIVAPSAACLGLGWVVFEALSNIDVLLGVAPDSWLCWGVPVLFLVTAVLGVLFAGCLRIWRREVYQGIGYAGNPGIEAVRTPRSPVDGKAGTR